MESTIKADKSDAIIVENNLLLGDREHIEEYFKICELYQQKRAFLKKSKDDPGVFRKEIAELNSAIKEKETLFWQRVQDALAKGGKFAVENVASLYGLDTFEKKILMFFLYLELFHITENICSEDVLLKIFDLDGSIIWKMGAFKYFSRNGNLLRYHILCPIYKNNGNSAIVSLAISSYMLNTFSKMISGEYKESKPEKEEGKKDSSSCEEVGFLKEPAYCIEDVKLSEEIKEKVIFFLQALKNNSLEKFEVSQRIKKGLGTAFLFYGPSGTGKSMLAEAVAAYVVKKVLVVEYPKIMDRFVGATDKNISRIFKSAEEEDLVIILDEADTLFYNRSFAYEEHDIRFVNEMLQELEKFKGIIILTSNMSLLLDPALERRLSLKVKFELPSKELRLKIWQSHIPDKVNLVEGVNFEMLAAKYDFAGGSIKNAVLNAIRKMASRNGDTLTLEDLVFGARLEQDGIFVKENKSKIGFFANS